MISSIEKVQIVCVAKLQKKYSTPSHKADTKNTKIKNNDYFNLSLCLLWFLGVRRRANPRQPADDLCV